jgi:hypothetical protein
MPWQGTNVVDPYHRPFVGWWEDLGLSNLDEESDE